jgi:soluble lytic murein transglycosylase-like protein
VPPILIASIAMQESTCNPNTVGGAGEQGLMQLTKDKCTQAPGGNCKDPNYNIQTGSKFFADSLKANGGDLLHTIGGYNGWPQKMTFVSGIQLIDRMS